MDISTNLVLRSAWPDWAKFRQRGVFLEVLGNFWRVHVLLDKKHLNLFWQSLPYIFIVVRQIFCTNNTAIWSHCQDLLIRQCKGSFTLAAAVCGFRSGLRQHRDRNFSISAEQRNRLPQTHAENAVM